MQGEILISERLKKYSRRAAALALAGAALLTSLSGCSGKVSGMLHPTTVPTTETVPTEPPATIPADGNPEDVTCRGTYTADSVDGSRIVARIEDQELNNNTLNILYRLAINAYEAEEDEPAPDFTKPLDSQICELEGDHITWQQYFLQNAIESWQAIQVLERRSHMPMVNNELNFEVDHAKHEQYMVDIPICDTVLYDEDTSFELHKKDQLYMDELPTVMRALAEEKGYSSLREMVTREFGASVTETDFQDFAYLANYAYLYFISLTYDPRPTEEDLTAIIEGLPGTYEPMVDMRHILIYTDDASVGPDGKLQADEATWDDSFKEAKFILDKFQQSRKQDDVAFSVQAHDRTRDEGSRLTGGLYANVRKGQMIEPLDQWLFAPERQPGDTGLVKSEYGWHILYLKAQKDARTLDAQQIFRENSMKRILEEAVYNYPMTVMYDQIQLNRMENRQGSLTMAEDLLYEDKGHERFPEVPVYIQQDYPKAMYGNYKLTTHGCGISALAMLSTYMADELHTPATLAVQFGRYNGLHGTDWKMFTEAPPELGYFLYKRSGVWKDVEDNLREGRMAISLQVKGYFTRAGHYLVISELLDDGRVVLRDSNLYNYTRLPEHKEDMFKPQKLLPNNQGFWIYDNKVVTVKNCSRCGEEERTGIPQLFVDEDYVCHKCIPALERRTAFLDLCRFH